MSIDPQTNEIELDAALRNAIRSYVQCRQEHSPMPCYRQDEASACALKPLLEQWRRRDATTPRDEHPQVFALSEAGCHRNRAKMVVSGVGYGISDISNVVAAHVAQAESQRSVLPQGIQTCAQCQPGTNTYAWHGPDYVGSGACHRLPIPLAQFAYQLREQSSSGRVLCLGSGGNLRFCGPGEFMAVSHVWDQGWKGVSEDGICSRVLEYLLAAASRFDLEWIWLDIAIISGKPDLRTMAINAMNRIYSTAKVTLVCDRLLLSMKGGSPREKALALGACDWMTRVWTMQEALLSKNVYVAQHDQAWNTEELLNALVFSTEANAGQAYGAIQMLFGMVDNLVNTTETILERVILLCGERTTSQQVDMARALYPLFNLEWPGPDTTLIQGQVRLLQHLGKAASRCWGMFGPVGLPSPWSWAPLTLAGCSGGLAKGGGGVSPEGLLGRWAWREVKATGQERSGARTGQLVSHQGIQGVFKNIMSAIEYGSRSKWSNNAPLSEVGSSLIGDIYRGWKSTSSSVWQTSHSEVLANLTGNASALVAFSNPNGEHVLSALVYYHPSNPFPWSGAKPLYLLTYTTRNDGRQWSRYDLVIVESSEEQWFRMHRVASVFGPHIAMDETDTIQGVLS